MFYEKWCSQKFQKLTEKHLRQSLFNKVAGLSKAPLLKKRFWHRCFPVNFAKFLRAPFLQNTSGRLLYLKSRWKWMEACLQNCWLLLICYWISCLITFNEIFFNLITFNNCSIMCFSLKRMWNIFLAYSYSTTKFVYVVIPSIIVETAFLCLSHRLQMSSTS